MVASAVSVATAVVFLVVSAAVGVAGARVFVLVAPGALVRWFCHSTMRDVDVGVLNLGENS